MILNPSNGTPAPPLPADLQRALEAAMATGRCLIVAASIPEGSPPIGAVFCSPGFPREEVVNVLKTAAAETLKRQSLVILPATTPNGILRAG